MWWWVVEGGVVEVGGEGVVKREWRVVDLVDKVMIEDVDPTLGIKIM